MYATRGTGIMFIDGTSSSADQPAERERRIVKIIVHIGEMSDERGMKVQDRIVLFDH